MRDITLGDTIYPRFTTRAFATGIPTTLAGTPVLSVYEENNLTQITTGVSVTVDYDSVTGLNQATIVATSGNGYESGKSYDLVITTGTVGGVSVVGEVVGSFTVEAHPVNWAKVTNPATAVDLSATDIQLCDTITTYTGNTPQTGNSYARLGAPAGASIAADLLVIDNFVDGIETAVITNAAGVDIAADIIAVKAETALIVADTNELQTDNVPGLIATAQADLDILTGTNGVTLATSQPNYAPNTVVPDAAGVAPTAVEVRTEMDSNSTQLAAIVVDTGTTLDNHLTDIKGTGFVKDTHSLIDIEAYVDLIDDGTSGLAKIATDVAAILLDTNELQTDDVPGLIAALNDLSSANVLTQVNAALDTAIAELGVAAPAATPTLRTGLMLLYMALRNKTVVQTSGVDALEIYNNAGTMIASKALTDDGSDYSEAEMV